MTPQHLLTQVGFKIATLQNARQQFSKQLAPDFQIFDYLRCDEMGVSTCLAGLLDPRGNHGQGSIFLELFLERIQVSETWAPDLDTCRVVTEKQAHGQRRLDIFLTLQQGVIGIENKPWAADQDKQLADYADYLAEQSRDGNWMLVYLANWDPSSNSIPTARLAALQHSNNYIQLSFHQVISWLDACAAKSQALPVRVFIEQLSKFIHANVNGAVEMSEYHEIKTTLLSQPDALQTAHKISLALTDLKLELLAKLQQDFVQQVSKAGLIPVWDERVMKGQAYSGFGIKYQASQSLLLRFEFDARQHNCFFWGIARVDESVVHDMAIWQQLNSAMANHYGSSEQWPWWPWYSGTPNLQLDPGDPNSDSLVNWQSNDKPWLMIHSGELVKNMVSLATNVRDVLDKAGVLGTL